MLTNQELLLLKYASKDSKYANLQITKTSTIGQLLDYHNGPLLKYEAEKNSAIQRLLQLKFCILLKAFFGPLKIESGEKYLKITEEGKNYLSRLEL